MSNHHHSSPLPYCFRPAPTSSNHHSMAAPPISGNPNLTTSVFHTDLGLFALTWSRTVLGRSLHLHLLLHNDDDDLTLSPSSLSSPCFHLQIKPYIFWNKHGSKKLKINNTSPTTKTIQIFWDLSRAKFGTRPEPKSGYFIAIVISGEITVLAGDSSDEAYSKTKARKPCRLPTMVLRREHVYGNKLYTTKATFGGQTRDLTIDCRVGEESKLYFGIDGKRVLQVKHLKWKFRGNERIEFDGNYIHVSWDVYNWLFEEDEDGYALFMFRFEKSGSEEEADYNNNANVFWSQRSCGFGFEERKMKKSLMRRTARSSSSSSSLSSASSGCSSVMDWASVEENELKDPSGFSLLVYAWKS